MTMMEMLLEIVLVIDSGAAAAQTDYILFVWCEHLHQKTQHRDVAMHGIFCVVCMLHPSKNLYRTMVVLVVLSLELAYHQLFAACRSGSARDWHCAHQGYHPHSI